MIRPSTRPVSLLVLIGLAAIGCGASGPQEAPAPVGKRGQSIASVMGGVEWSIDAPWRMEPTLPPFPGGDILTDGPLQAQGDGPSTSGPPKAGGGLLKLGKASALAAKGLKPQGLTYGAIPITLTFHDASEQHDPATAVSLGEFCGVIINKLPMDCGLSAYERYPARTFHEIEAHAKWPYSSDAPAFDRLRRLWAGDDYTDVLDVGQSAEWNATLLYSPGYVPPGTDLLLQVNAVISTTNKCPDWFDQSMDIWNETLQSYRGVLKVHYGEAPLPRFDSRWVYGDLHYHSQGTDNEGESALSYRAVSQSMKALGLDFLFASEHASNSGQVTGFQRIFVNNLPDSVLGIPIPGVVHDWLLSMLQDNIDPIPYEGSVDTRRDMSPRRFTFLRHWLNDANGVNQEVLSSPGGRAPQIFLGGEVDVIPEISEAERASGSLYYGDQREFLWNTCNYVPDIIRTAEKYTSFEVCSSSVLEPASEGGRYLVRDVQGLGDHYFARQHLLSLPYDSSRDSAFVASDTTMYGGAQKRLKDMLHDDFEANIVDGHDEGSKGYVFLAHPVAAASGSDEARLGPDIMPYSDVQLRTAFESRYVLGLQLWNEDSRMASDGDTDSFPRALAGCTSPLAPVRGWDRVDQDGQLSSLHNGAAAFDKMLLWSLDPAKKPASAPVWPRKVFMAGGSDAHGDLNFRRLGAVTGWAGSVDSAIGKPRNLVFVGDSRPVPLSASGRTASAIGQSQVLDGLRSGQFTVTDGPLVRIAIDGNANGIVDDADTPMGGTYISHENTLPLLIEWKSTPEFGPVTSIDLYVGAYAKEHPEGAVYAPPDHAVRGQKDFGSSGQTYTGGGGFSRQIMADSYYLDPNGKLRVAVNGSCSASSCGGTVRVMLDPNHYKLFSRSCTTEKQCTKPHYPEQPKPICSYVTTCGASDVTPPERLFVRAFARSHNTEPTADGVSHDIPRLAYTNPIWIISDPMFPDVDGVYAP